MAKTKYSEDFPRRAEGYARDGLIDEQMAAKLGISKQTFYDYQKRYPDFLDAIKRGKAPVDDDVESALLKSALGWDYEEVHTEIREVNGKQYKTIKKVKRIVPPSNTAQIFWLKNRRPKKWRDKQDLNITDDIELTVTIVDG